MTKCFVPLFPNHQIRHKPKTKRCPDGKVSLRTRESNTNRTHPGGADSSESTETSEIAENQDKTIPFQDGANTSWEPKAKRVRIGADSSECGQGKSEASEDAENLKKTDADHNTSGRQKISFNRIPTDEWVRRRWLKWLGQY